MGADQENTSEAEDHKDVHADMVTEGIEFRVRKGSSDEVEGQVEVGLQLSMSISFLGVTRDLREKRM